MNGAFWRRRRRAAWLVPGGVALVVAAVSLIATAGSSAAAPTLPAKTPQQLLTAIGRSQTTAFSGTVQESAALGLPTLPGGRNSASLSWQSLITGTHSARVWVDGPTRQRIGVLGQLSEAEIVHNGRDLWTYTSATNTATHTVLPDRSGARERSASLPEQAFDPAAVATQLLKKLEPTTVVSVDTAQTVAGRATYTLVLQPRDSHSTVRSVRIAVDAQHYLPLKVQVFGAGASPAFQVGFTKVSFTAPPASRFDFSVPAGANVGGNPFTGGQRHRASSGTVPGGLTATVLGHGWTTVVELHGVQAAQLPSAAGVSVDKLTVPVGTSGARLLRTALVNAVLLPDGRAFVGAVDPGTLEHIAATTAH